MRRNLFFCFLAILTVAVTVSSRASKADAFASEPLNRFEGEWKGDGKFSGMAASAASKWEWVLNGKFLRLSIRYEMKSPDGKTQIFEGLGYYQPKGNGEYDGRWFDSQGNAYPIKASIENDKLTSKWGEPGKYEGKSVYRISEVEKTLEIVDSIKQKDGGWREFSRFKLLQKR